MYDERVIPTLTVEELKEIFATQLDLPVAHDGNAGMELSRMMCPLDWAYYQKGIEVDFGYDRVYLHDQGGFRDTTALEKEFIQTVDGTHKRWEEVTGAKAVAILEGTK